MTETSGENVGVTVNLAERVLTRSGRSSAAGAIGRGLLPDTPDEVMARGAADGSILCWRKTSLVGAIEPVRQRPVPRRHPKPPLRCGVGPACAGTPARK